MGAGQFQDWVTMYDRPHDLTLTETV